MKREKNKFTIPTLYGLLCESNKSASGAKKIERILKKYDSNSICLPLIVKKRNLKNIVKCMKLLDFHARFVADSHRNSLARQLKSKTKNVDIVVRTGKKSQGKSVWLEVFKKELPIPHASDTKLIRTQVEHVIAHGET